MSMRMAGALISGAMLGKLLGFARELEMARLLGVSIVADSFRGAMTAVLLPVAPIQSDMLPAVLIPLHRDWQDDRQAERTGALAVVLTLFAVVVAAAVFALAAPWVGVLVGGFDASAQALTIHFVQLMALAIPASVLSAVLSAFEIATGTSRIAATRASVQNIGLMAGIAVMALTGQALAVPLGFVIAFNLTAAYGVVTLRRKAAITLRGLRPRLLIEVGAAFWVRFRPLLVIPLADQGNILLERALASGVALGAVASLDYARTLTETTFYLVSQPIGYVVLTRALAGGDVRNEVRVISRRLLALGLPVSVFIATFAPDIVRVVFARGAFDEHAVALTAGALRGISTGLWAAMLGWVLVRMVNASGRNGTAALIIVSAYAANVLVNVAAVPSLGTLGLGFGEAARGLVLLGGTAVALGCSALMLGCVARGAVGAVALAAVGVAICATVEGSPARLAVGIPVFGIATAGWLAATMPGPARQLAGLIRHPRRLATAGWRQS